MTPIKNVRDTLALCDLSRARRTEPTRPLIRMTPAEQAAFWRKTPVKR
jgi:hypothetical protein